MLRSDHVPPCTSLLHAAESRPLSSQHEKHNPMPERFSQPWVAIQRNPTSGSGARRRQLLDLVRRLRQLGLVPRMYSQRERLARVLEDDSRRASLRCIVAAGGDGTVRDAINRYPGLPLAILPMGTENLFARFAGLTRSGRQLADVIAHGAAIRIDAGEVNGQRFALMASFGVDAEVIEELDRRRNGNISHLSYVRPILSAFSRYRYPPLRVWIDEATEPRVGRQVILVNIPRYARGLRFATDAELDDGRLDVRIFERGSTWNMLRYLWHVWHGTHEALEDVQCMKGQRIRVESDEPVPLQVDGDPGGTTPADFTVARSALTILVPEAFAETHPHLRVP